MFQAAGVIPVTHASGGPLNDIVVPFEGHPTGAFIPQYSSPYLSRDDIDLGYHATSPETYAETFDKVFSLDPEEELALRTRTRTWAVQRFSQEEFEKGWDQSRWKEFV